ncbi:MAG: hypothetical protein COW65_16820 [Cytophagales bacterium CG18_big_fil_WC_8_21_14_2_50_42_9]|nr:MAG: hypothetical protein COW65_16820 [Cytophagales bacterium CG18_big_fil_WC_8_21_14_2_50_42_9]
MNKLFGQWIFIHYCGQIIGQWSKKQAPETLVNVLISNIGLSTLGIPVLFFLLIGGKSPVWGTLCVVVYFIMLLLFLKKLLVKIIDFQQLNNAYNQLSKQQRISNFIISILSIPFSILVSILSFKLIGVIF